MKIDSQELKVLTKEEEIVVFLPQELCLDLKSIEVIEMVKDKVLTVGYLIMGKRAIDNKRVGIIHRELNKPLFFEKQITAKKYATMVRKLIKNKNGAKNLTHE